jgi:hypothetical protein
MINSIYKIENFFYVRDFFGGKLDNVYAFVRLNSICHAHFCLISGVRPSL